MGGGTGKIALDYAAAASDVTAATIPSATEITATTSAVSDQAVTVTPATTGTASTVKLVFKTAIHMPALTTSKVVLTLPNFAVSGTAAPTVEGCGTGTPVFTTTVANSGEANAAITFALSAATAANDIEPATACTITTASGTVTNPASALAANWGDTGKIALDYATAANDLTAQTIPSATAITAPTPPPTPTNTSAP